MKRKIALAFVVSLLGIGNSYAQNSTYYNDGNVGTAQGSLTSTKSDDGVIQYNDDIDNTQWWKRFGDTMLDSLIELATQRNYDVAMAARRIEMARQNVASAKASYYPHIGITAGWTQARESGGIRGVNVPADKTSYWNAGATMQWEIDVFGKVRASVKQQNSMLRVSRAEYASAMIALQAEFATAYINLRVYQAEMRVALEHSESQAQVVAITEARHKAGLASMLDVAQAKTVYYSTKASIPLLETSIRTAVNSIAILLAETPADLYAQLSIARDPLEYKQIVPSTLSLDLINRRPDIVAARQQVAAAAEALGIARKDYLPTLTLTGSIGMSTHNIKDAFDNNTLTYSVAPTLSWTLFDGFARRSATATAKQNLENEIDSYNLTVLNAVSEADNAMTGYINEMDYMKSIDEVVTQSRKACELSLDLYKRGLTAFSNVVDAQLNLLEYRNSLIVAKGNAMVSLINLYKALGGGWNNDID